jgi:hypothetical protein
MLWKPYKECVESSAVRGKGWVGPSPLDVCWAVDLGRRPEAGMVTRRWRYLRCLPDDRHPCRHTLAVNDDA